jgi:triosephosphate isomerase
MARKPVIVGNWKMNGIQQESLDLLAGINHQATHCEVVVCPSFTALSLAINHPARTGAQDCHVATSGAHTGDISATMLKDIGCDYVITGHSERRKDHLETSALVSQKSEAAHNANLIAIICIGETLADREAGNTLDILAEQIKSSLPSTCTDANTIIAYEPIWAIGTGKVANLEQITEAHDFINRFIAENFAHMAEPTNALYGGSLKPENAKDILSIDSVGGGLIGGASLKAESFNAIIGAA